jgi:RNA polymerase sigma factor (TIGR02999 family)
MAPGEPHDVTRLLAELSGGDTSAAERLMPLVYEQLRALAGSYFRDQPPNQTLQPTALAHEAFARLVEQPQAHFDNRVHFMAVAAKAMRQILADHARARRSAKRGGGWTRVSLDRPIARTTWSEVDLVDLDDVLTRLAELNERHARIVELRFFGGLTTREVGNVLGVTRTTVDNDWRVARAWLRSQLAESA